jgi:riboflavin kinase / FMN adenylyltransferase
MHRLPGDRPVPDPLRGAVVALGNFDGFHVGHQAVVGRALELARAEGRPAIVATFDPHPARLFRPDAPPFLLTGIAQRFDLFEGFGVDGAIALPFDRTIAAETPEMFVDLWLRERMGAATVVTGWDFTFGKDRSGDTDTLRTLTAARLMASDTVAALEADGDVASSTRIRQHLVAGEMDKAERLLTRPFTIRGTVQHGDKLGRTIGFPTANIALGDYQRARYGIYAVRGHLPDGRIVGGAANLGIRPSFDPPKELLEPHFFDFSGDLYEQEIEIELVAFLRPEAKYDGLEALTAQIAIDCDQARQILAARARAL